MSKLSGKIIEVERIGDSDAGRVVGESLKALREFAGLTQTEIASRLGISHTVVSKIERHGDVQISLLQRYVQALGAQLCIDASFPASTPFLSHLRDAFENDVPDEDQLILPIFGDDLFRPQRDVVLSIRPQYSEKIMAGEKTIELRRRFPMSAPKGTIAYIYSTSPIRAIVGRAEIVDVIKLRITDIWKKYSQQAFIEKRDFDNYFEGLDEGYALKFANASPLPRQLDLTELRERFGFEPPQSFLYAKPVLRRALQNEYSDVSN